MPNVRRPAYVLKVRDISSSTGTGRDTVLTPSKGFRIRLVRVRVVQEKPDGRHLWELYFGEGASLIADLKKGIDILSIPNNGSDSTRTYLRGEGPRGLRDEVLSGRWRGTAPANAHRIIIEYSEEP